MCNASGRGPDLFGMVVAVVLRSRLDIVGFTSIRFSAASALSEDAHFSPSVYQIAIDTAEDAESIDEYVVAPDILTAVQLGYDWRWLSLSCAEA